MGKINLLDTEISNKIAAGEVVERPASVVKELVENSIDAGASKITVEIRNGGNTYIKVSDNGVGMEKDDAHVAFLRHATSKIKTEEDLNAIYTLGFRGEALSSIGAVSQVSLYTKRKEDSFGTHTECEGGEIISNEDAGAVDGTTFIVKNLFFNVPARMKFLKKDATEAGYITDIMSRFVLAHPEIAFTLISNNKPVITSYGDNNLENAVYALYGKDYAKQTIKVNFSTEHIRISGLCGKGSTARPNRAYQSFFINGRYIKSPLIMRAVEEAYKNQVMIGKFPMAILNVEINPSLVDINVHPTKLEVKFSNESEIYSAVYHAVYEALYRIADIPEIKRVEKDEKKETFTVPKAEEKPLIKPEEPKKEVYIKKEEPQIKSFDTKPLTQNKETIIQEPKMFSQRLDGFIKKSQEPQKEEEKPTAQIFTDTKEQKTEQIAVDFKAEKKDEKEPLKIPEFKLIGQIFDTYIIIEIDDRIEIIDQHAAHERLKYEEIKKLVEEKKTYSQGLAIGLVVNLSALEMAQFLQNTQFISSLGFEAEEYGNNTVIIRAVPQSFVDDDVSELFIEILGQLEENKKEIITAKKERLLYTIACKAAIKANHTLSIEEQKNLVRMVKGLENINTCPHGRPIIVSMTKKEIEKTFKRIV